ncbi:MAG: U32 family peptidase [Mollicutes bacterium]|nr:U32 family peptidase [Mollicutes bacterium]
MKLLVEPMNKENLKFNCDGLILAIKDYAVESNTYFTLEEIKNISDSFSGEIFVKLNKNLMNDDIPFVKDILVQLDKMNITGVFFYDLAVLELKRELNLNIDLVWNQTHMVNNYKTCNYYYSKGVKYALIGKEITLDEILEIIDLSDITSMVEVVSKPSVAFSKRKLVSNYYKDMGINGSKEIIVNEKVSNLNFDIKEDSNGTVFFLDLITNGTSIIRDLYDNGCSYIIMREYGIDNFRELVNDTMEYIKDSCSDLSYVLKYKKLGDSTNFFFKKTIYRVKKNG